MAITAEQVQAAKTTYDQLKDAFELQQDVRVTKQMAEEAKAFETSPAHFYVIYIFQMPNGYSGRVVYKGDRRSRRRVFEAVSPNLSALRNELRQHAEQGVTPEDTRA